jgi:hypothetical protein
MTSPICVVYWLYDSQCICPWRHGYIGISIRLPFRLRQHIKRKNFRRDFEWKILFEGPLYECRVLEYRLRPKANIGWNKGAGGGRQNLGLNIRHPAKWPEWRQKIASGLAGHVRTPESRAKQSASVKGRPKSAEWKAKASAIATARYSDPTERARMSVAVKRGKSKLRSRTQPDLFDD